MKIKSKKRVIVAMSGGVDSSVAAKLLVDNGHEVVGIFLHFWKDDFQVKNGQTSENKCCSAEALMDARRVCQKIGIPLYTLNFATEFKKQVVDYFLRGYEKGNTPNPCVACNKFIKLGLLVKYAKKLGFDYVASGHYAKIKKLNSIFKLYKGKDKEKDQSYFLWTFNQDELKHLLFPLGGYKKSEVRKLAKKFKLPVAEKSESQEVCFIQGKSTNDFLKKHIKLKPGAIKTLDGEVIGEHKGLSLYTIGQRRGVEIGGTGPYYVVKADYKKNVLYVANGVNSPSLFSDSLAVKNINWISGVKLNFPLKCEAVIRYRHTPVKCIVNLILKDLNRNKNKRLFVKFAKPVRAVTSGQSIVFYNGKEVLGGGIIDKKK